MPAYKDKVTGTWTARFYYETHDGFRKQKNKRGFTLKKDADKFERDFLAKLKGNPDITFESAAREYLDDMQHRVRVSTFEIKKSIFRNYLTPYFKNKSIAKITPKDIRSWQKDILSKNLADTYLRRINTELSAIFNYATRYYGLTENLHKHVKKIGKRETNNLEFWTLEEFNKFIDYFKEDNKTHIQYRAVFNLLFYTGMRIGELEALTLNDIDFTARTININKTYQRVARKDLIGPPKTVSSNRVIAVPDHVLDCLREYIELLYEPSQDARIFLHTREAFAKMMKKAATVQGVKIIRLHDLRHSHASLLIEMGFNPLVIQERLGHKNVEIILNTYSHLYPHKQQEVAEKLNNLLRPAIKTSLCTLLIQRLFLAFF